MMEHTEINWIHARQDEDIEHEDEDDDEEGPEGDGRAGGAGNPIVLEDDDLEAYDDYEEGAPGGPHACRGGCRRRGGAAGR